jgi:hypothetical protein
MSVHILQDQNAWGRNFENAIPEIGAVMKCTAADWRLSAAQMGGCRVSDGGWCVLEHATDAGVGKARVTEPDIKRLDRIRHRAGIELA